MALVSFSSNTQADALKTALNDPKRKADLSVPTNVQDPYQLPKLIEFSWRGISFPVTNISTNISQSVVEHTFPGMDSARLENTGRNPIVISATGVFVNTINPGPKETWKAGTLYPNVYQQVIQACIDTSDDILMHPAFGFIRVRCLSASDKTDSHFQGGALVDITWKETISDNGAIYTYSATSLGNATATANALDQQIDTANALAIASPPKFNQTLGNLVLQIRAIADTASLVAEEAIGTINQGIHYCNELLNYCSIQNNVDLAQLKMQANLMKSQLIELKRNLAISANDHILIYNTTQPISLSAIGKRVNNTVTQLMNLNPNLLSSPLVPAHTNVKYFG